MRFLFLSFLLIAALPARAEADRFIPVCMSGEAAGQGACSAQPQPGSRSDAWACTRDTRTRLVWSLESGRGDWRYATTAYPKALNETSRCGFSSGWRLPTRSELLTLLNRSGGGAQTLLQTLASRDAARPPAIDVRHFPGSQEDGYWSADTFGPDPSFAWFVFFKPGYDNEGNAYSSFKAETKYARLVHDDR